MWPATVLAVANIAQVCILAWIASKQAQVKRELNGHQDQMQDEIFSLRKAIEQRTRPVPARRVFPPET